MTEYHDMTPEERFAALDRMASQLFETTQWRKQFAERYGLATSKPITRWKHDGPPTWALVAARDALDAKRLVEIRELMRGADT